MGLRDIALTAKDMVVGFPWGEIRDDQGQVVDANDAVYTMQWYDLLADKIRETQSAMAKYAMWWDVADRSALTGVVLARDELLSKEDKFWIAVRTNAPEVVGGGALQYDVEQYRAMIGDCWMSAIDVGYGLLSMILHMSGESPATIVTATDRLWAQCELLLLLEEAGWLDPIKKGAPRAESTAGLGELTTLGVIAIVAVATIAAFAYLWYVTEQNAQVVRIIEANCRDAQNATDPAMKDKLLDACLKGREKAAAAAQEQADMIGPILNKVVTIAAVAGLAYAGILMYPNILAALGRAKSAKAAAPA